MTEPANNRTPNEPKPDPLADIAQRVAALKFYATHWISVKIDQLKLSVAKLVLLAILGTIALIVVTAMLAAAGIFIVHGAALGLARILNDQLWAGYLVAGVLTLLSTVVAVLFMTAFVRKKMARSLADKYAERRTNMPAQNGETNNGVATSTNRPQPSPATRSPVGP